MPTNPPPGLSRDQTDHINNWLDLTQGLIAAAVEYAGTGVEDPEASMNIRRVRIQTAALNAALMAVAFPVVTAPPPPLPVTPVSPTQATTTKAPPPASAPRK